MSDDRSIPHPGWRTLLTSEDWLAVWLGALLLLMSLAAVYGALPAAEWQDQDPGADRTARSRPVVNPLAAWVARPADWAANPLAAFYQAGSGAGPRLNRLPALATTGILCAAILTLGAAGLGVAPRRFVPAFLAVFFLAVLAEVLAAQQVIAYYGLEYPLWALLIGLIISNTLGTPAWLWPGLRTEFYIKTGLVLLGAEVLLGRLVALGLPGVGISWIATPIVLISTYLFGQKVLKIPSRSLNMTISADMSVCGVSAAIATAAACRAKKEELSLAIGISLAFTVLMMVVMPPVIKALDMGPALGGAWVGGTIDSTGAVAVAGELLDDGQDKTALTVAVTIKMIQNILIGVVAFGVAVYWTGWVEPAETGQRPSAWEIWRRFPRFVLGFIAASAVFSWLHESPLGGKDIVTAATSATKVLREWFFCLGFVSIGLETNFRDLAKHLRGGKPVVLYVVGQSFNLALTLLMAWLMFEVLFPDAAAGLGQ